MDVPEAQRVLEGRGRLWAAFQVRGLYETGRGRREVLERPRPWGAQRKGSHKLETIELGSVCTCAKQCVQRPSGCACVLRRGEYVSRPKDQSAGTTLLNPPVVEHGVGMGFK